MKQQYKSNASRDGFGQQLLELAQKNKDIVVVSADLTESMRLHWFRSSFPDRFVEVGVAEQNLAGVAAGLALAGKIPVAASYAVFHPGNSWGVIRSSICYSNLNVKLVGGHAGISIGPDGATHQALEDIALMRVLPNMTVTVPADAHQAAHALSAHIQHVGPTYLRITKYDAGALPTTKKFSLKSAQILREGEDVTLIACGTMVAAAVAAADQLAHTGIQAAVINMHTIKPLDVAAIKQAARTTKLLVTIEEHQISGGLGGAVAETLAEMRNPRARLIRAGIDDQFGQSGSSDALLNHYGLTAKKIAQLVHASL